jgi:hypothetical protein
MKKYLLVSIILTAFIQLNAQKETDHWYFGVSAGLDFTSGTPVQESPPIAYSINEGTSSISTTSGNLMLWSDGTQLYNANHVVTPNGSGLNGDISTTQSSLFVPKPGSNTQFYLFTLAPDGGSNGFQYSIIDMTLDGGLGDITATKNVFVEDSMTEKMCAIRTTVGGSYWILTHRWTTNEFYAYELTSGGLQPPVISAVGMVHNDSVIQNTYGQMKFNMCATKVALAIGYQNVVEVFDFNQSTGVVSNPLTLNQNDHVYGIEFSPNSNLLYLSSYDVSGTLLQYNISLGSLPLILASRTPLTVTPDIYALQIASDGKIYAARSFGATNLGVINSPNTTGFACGYSDMGPALDTAFMGNSSGLGLPGFMQTYLKNALAITCSGGSGLEDQPFSSIGVYPNPTMDEFFIELNGLENVEMTVVDNTGRMVEQLVSTTDYIRFGSKYVPGIYFVTLRSGNASRVMKVVKS